jgi:PleD family two-component response regulator
LLLKAFRGEDIVGRWGGAEFFIGMYGMRCADGVQRLAEILETFREIQFATSDDDRLSTTFGAGVAEFGVDGSNLQELYRSANTALFAAKEAGGNRVIAAQSARDAADLPALMDIVIVEDDEALAPLLMHTFETRGLRAQWIDAGDDAVEQLAGANPTVRARVVVLDWDLPGLSGPGVLRALADSRVLEHTRVIMLTGRSTEAEVLSTLETGASDHVAKPFSIPVLMQRIRRLLDESSPIAGSQE